MSKSIRAAKLENVALKKKITALENTKSMADADLRNSISTLVQSAQLQSNLTSFSPIIQNNIYAPLTLNWQILMYMYKTHGVIQTAIDMPVLDALRGGLDIQSGELDVDDIKDLNDLMEDAGILQTIGEAQTWARLFGGAGLIINTNQDPATPLEEDAKFEKLEFYAANRWELMTQDGVNPQSQALNMMPYLGRAKRTDNFFYFYGHKIHSSRVIILTGKEAPYTLKWQLAGWGMSEVERMIEDFNAYIKTKEVLYQLLEEAKIDVYHLEGLKSQLVSEAGTQMTQRRMEMMNQMKTFQNAIVLDKEDIFEQKQITFSGMAEVMKENRIGIASALRMPLTKLFGLSATGFNSGEDDIENYNAMVESEVRQKLRRPIKKVLNLIATHLFGYVPDLNFEFRPLRVLGSVEEEQVLTSKQNRYIALYDRALINSKEIGEIMEKDNLVPVETEAAKGLLEEHPEIPGQEAEGEEGGGEKKKEKKPS